METIEAINLDKLRDETYQNAVEHGWHDEDLSDEHFLCLVISELMEAVQAERKGKRSDVVKFNEWQGNNIPFSEETRVRGVTNILYKSNSKVIKSLRLLNSLKELICVYRIRLLKVCIHLDPKPYLTGMNILPENLYVTNLKEIYASVNSYLYLLHILFCIL